MSKLINVDLAAEGGAFIGGDPANVIALFLSGIPRKERKVHLYPPRMASANRAAASRNRRGLRGDPQKELTRSLRSILAEKRGGLLHGGSIRKDMDLRPFWHDGKPLQDSVPLIGVGTGIQKIALDGD